MTETRELTNEELDLAFGGQIHVARIGGITFAHDDVSGTTTVSAGNASVTVGTINGHTPYRQVFN